MPPRVFCYPACLLPNQAPNDVFRSVLTSWNLPYWHSSLQHLSGTLLSQPGGVWSDMPTIDGKR